MGVYINDILDDVKDIERQRKGIYSKGNVLIRRFSNCSIDIKTQLFNSYCSSMYCSPLWNNYTHNAFKGLRVAYNNTFRYLLSVKGRCSVSQLFLDHNVDSFNVLHRKLVFNLKERVFSSGNNIIKTITSSLYFMHVSKLHKSWISMLYTF